MKLEDRFFVGEHGTRMSGHFPDISIDSFKIIELLRRFDKKGIKIDLSRSEKRVTYEGSSNLSPVFIPFSLPSNVDLFKLSYRILGYKLVGNGLTICIDDYHTAVSQHPGHIGSSVYAKDGINVEVSFEGGWQEGKVLEDVREVIENYYRDKIYRTPLGLPIKRELRKMKVSK